MSEIMDIINELNLNNGSNYKLDVLKKYKNDEFLKRILQMTEDRVKYTYGLSVKHWNKGDAAKAIFSDAKVVKYKLEDVLDFMENDLATRKVTGNKAIEMMDDFLMGLSLDDTTVATRVLNRDLRINMGRTQVNKVFPGLIQKPMYMRCGVYSKDTAKKINPKGAFVQLKADGTYREFTVENGIVTSNSRSGESYEYPLLNETMSEYPDGHYFGELTVMRDGVVLDRATGNGLINSLEPPHENIVLDAWDYVTLEEYTDASNKVKCKTPYWKRLGKLKEILFDISGKGSNVRVIETHEVNSIKEALEHCNHWMEMGLEGAILKDRDSVFRDGTNPQQLKLKLEIDIEVRLVGFQEGTIGTAREKTFGAILFETDDGQIKGKCSGFTDEQLFDYNSRREEMIGKIFTVQFNDLTKARHNEYYALSHPRFIEIRDDKTETDTLESALQLKKMAMELS